MTNPSTPVMDISFIVFCLTLYLIPFILGVRYIRQKNIPLHYLWLYLFIPFPLAPYIIIRFVVNLVECPSCHNKIYTRMNFCPHCSYKIVYPNKQQYELINNNIPDTYREGSSKNIIQKDPSRPIGDVTNERIWQSYPYLVMHVNSNLPDRCVKTNKPANGKYIIRNLRWHHPLLYLIILIIPIGLLIYAIVATAMLRRVTIKIGVSDEILKKRRKNKIIGLLLFFIGITMLIIGKIYDLSALINFGILMIIVSPFWYYFTTSLIFPKRIETDYVWIKGICPEYLATFPEWEKR